MSGQSEIKARYLKTGQEATTFVNIDSTGNRDSYYIISLSASRDLDADKIFELPFDISGKDLVEAAEMLEGLYGDDLNELINSMNLTLLARMGNSVVMDEAQEEPEEIFLESVNSASARAMMMFAIQDFHSGASKRSKSRFFNALRRKRLGYKGDPQDLLVNF